jgi:hypothetical protein
MSTSSNLYAEKIFSEHPLSLWALDDVVDYISLISEEQRDMSGWKDIIGATVSESSSVTSPFPQSITNSLIGTGESESVNQITCISQDIINMSSLSREFGNFSIGGYFYSDSATISGFELGYEYYDVATGTTVQKLKSFQTPINKSWVFISETFEIPDDNTTMRIVAKINYFFSEQLQDSYTFYINGISLGQWSEEFNSTSLGIYPVDLPEELGFESSTQGIPAKTYGLAQNDGYYIVQSNKLVAKNTGIPMVYGATGVTRLYPNSAPSLVLPDQGFLNENGKFREYTVEFWLRVNNNSSEPKKIFGPCSTDDGLYVDGPLIILKINNNIQTYYVGEWGKPMLIDIKYSSNGISVLMNGDQIIEMKFDAASLSFIKEGVENNGFLGFWSYEEVPVIEIDCVAIYSYQVPNVVAKRRFVYGQGVDFPENINTAYSGSSVFIDYEFADYTNNYIYPDLGRWNQGVRNNIDIINNTLSAPNYSLPELVVESGDTSALESAVFNNTIQAEQDTFFTFKPSNSWTDNGYFMFDSFNFLQEEIKAFYAVIKALRETDEEEVILYIDSESTSNHFSIVIDGNQIKYKLLFNGEESVIYSAATVIPGEVFPIGIDIRKFSDYFGQNVASFFGNRSDLKFYVGGTKGFANSFHGKFYNISFCNSQNLAEVADLFNLKGCVLEYEDVFDLYTSNIDMNGGEYTGNDISFWRYFIDGGTPTEYSSYRLMDHTASYTLFVKNYFDKYYLDIAVKGYWKDYLPLSYFAQYVTDTKGDQYYDLDFIQFNIDYPAPSKYSKLESLPVQWKYGVPVTQDGITYPSLTQEYSSPVQRDYADLDNQLFTGYSDYTDLKNKASNTYIYDTDKSFVKSYITFEYVSSGINTSDNYFSTTLAAPKDGVISPGADWMRTKYEVVDNVIIYPPQENINELAMVTRLDFKIDGILTHKVKVKTLEYASQAFNESSPNRIGTRFGIPIYPYLKSGYYYNYKAKNPFSIYKKSSPYLFLTKNSGIELRGSYDPKIDRGLSIPINSSVVENFKVMAMQTAIKYDKDFFPYAPVQLFEIESADQHIKFFVVANSQNGKRGKVYAINAKTGQLENGIAFYWNGKIVKDPVMTVGEWGFLGISFSNLLDFSFTVGSIRVTSPIMFNILSFYQQTTLQEVQQITTRPWFKVKYAGVTELDWEFWHPAYRWGEVLVVSTKSYYGVDPEAIYKSYTGTNKIIIDTDNVFTLGGYEYNFYQNTSWQQNTITAI